jgi:hypothetical protein
MLLCSLNLKKPLKPFCWRKKKMISGTSECGIFYYKKEGSKAFSFFKAIHQISDLI